MQIFIYVDVFIQKVFQKQDAFGTRLKLIHKKTISTNIIIY